MKSIFKTRRALKCLNDLAFHFTLLSHLCIFVALDIYILKLKTLVIKDVMHGKLCQKCTHLLYCSVLSLGGNVNTKRTGFYMYAE